MDNPAHSRAPNKRKDATHTNTAPLSPLSPSSPSVTRSLSIVGNRQGRISTGLYPHISRTKLAEVVGRHTSTVTGMLKGRVRVSIGTAVKMAEVIGVTVEQLSRDLQERQEQVKREKHKAKAGAGAGTGKKKHA